MASPGNQHCANCIGTVSFRVGKCETWLAAPFRGGGKCAKFCYGKPKTISRVISLVSGFPYSSFLAFSGFVLSSLCRRVHVLPALFNKTSIPLNQLDEMWLHIRNPGKPAALSLPMTALRKGPFTLCAYMREHLHLGDTRRYTVVPYTVNCELAQLVGNPSCQLLGNYTVSQ